MKQRFYTLDFLKFIAAIVILMHHWQNSTQLELGAGNGWLMVELFFVISGFLAVNSIEKVREHGNGRGKIEWAARYGAGLKSAHIC